MSTSPSKSSRSLRRLCLSAVFAALVFAATAYLPRIQTGNGYVHLGDTLVFLCGSLLPAPYAMAAAAIGGGLADLLTGYAVWAPASFLIKGASALCFSARRQKILCLRNVTAIFPAALLCVGGYYLWAALVISGNFAAPVAELLPNLIQSAVSGLLYVGLASVFDRVPALRRGLQ